MFKKVGIIGLGLIGGSLAKALRNRLNTETIVAANRNEDVLLQAYNEGVIDQYSTEVTDIFCGCDIVFICTPVNSIASFAKKLTSFVDKDCIISDVGSTKGNIYDEMREMKDDFIFIGGHPMTGSEKFRYSASKEHLFENAYYILTPADNVSGNVIEEFKDGIEKIGAIPIVVAPYEHDYIVASISHVPHVIASALCNNVKQLDTDEKHMKLLAAGGFKDITRVASASPEMWENICTTNSTEIIKVLDNLEIVIRDIKNSILQKDSEKIYEYFDEARIYRDSFTSLTPGAYSKRYDINVDIIDRPGSIAIIAVLFSSNNINIKNMSIINSREHDNGVLQISFDSEDQRTKSVELLEGLNYEVTIRK